jgi:hypothetical protein
VKPGKAGLNQKLHEFQNFPNGLARSMPLVGAWVHFVQRLYYGMGIGTPEIKLFQKTA